MTTRRTDESETPEAAGKGSGGEAGGGAGPTARGPGEPAGGGEASPLAAEPPERLDTIGTVCPLPILYTAKAVLKLPVGGRLEVVGDDPAILDDMPVYCLRAGHRLIEMEEDDETGTIRCLIEKVRE